MNDSDHETVDRLLTEHGTSGLATLIAEVLEERAKEKDECSPLYLSAAKEYRKI